MAQTDLQFQVGELERALYAKVVKKCGNPNHWEEWAGDIAKIHMSRITQIVQSGSGEGASSEGGCGVSPQRNSSPSEATTPSSPDLHCGETRQPLSREYLTFKSFADELRDDLNDSITDAEVIEMLAQHLITRPVFDALFEEYSFAIHIEAVYHSITKGYHAAPTGLGRPVGVHDPCGAGTGALPRAGMNQAVGLEDSPAPTGQTIPAQGNALGLSQTENPSPEGRPMVTNPSKTSASPTPSNSTKRATSSAISSPTTATTTNAKRPSISESSWAIRRTQWITMATPSATPSPTLASPISNAPIRRKTKAAQSPRKTCPTTFTACCIPRTTAAATPTTSAGNSRASPPGRRLLISARSPKPGGILRIK